MYTKNLLFIFLLSSTFTATPYKKNKAECIRLIMNGCFGVFFAAATVSYPFLAEEKDHFTRITHNVFLANSMAVMAWSIMIIDKGVKGLRSLKKHKNHSIKKTNG